MNSGAGWSCWVFGRHLIRAKYDLRREKTWFWKRGSDGYIERVLVRNNGGR